MSPTSPPPPPPSTARSNTKWILFGCGGCLLLAIILIAVFGGLGFLGFKKIAAATKESPAYKEALSRVQNSPAVQEQLGTPITESALAAGSINKVNDSTTATFGFKVDGPKGSGMVNAQGQYSDGSPVNFSQLQVTLTTSGQTIDLLAPATESVQPPPVEETPTPPPGNQ